MNIGSRNIQLCKHATGTTTTSLFDAGKVGRKDRRILLNGLDLPRGKRAIGRLTHYEKALTIGILHFQHIAGKLLHLTE